MVISILADTVDCSYSELYCSVCVCVCVSIQIPSPACSAQIPRPGAVRCSEHRQDETIYSQEKRNNSVWSECRSFKSSFHRGDREKWKDEHPLSSHSPLYLYSPLMKGVISVWIPSVSSIYSPFRSNLLFTEETGKRRTSLLLSLPLYQSSFMTVGIFPISPPLFSIHDSGDMISVRSVMAQSPVLSVSCQGRHWRYGCLLPLNSAAQPKPGQ